MSYDPIATHQRILELAGVSEFGAPEASPLSEYVHPNFDYDYVVENLRRRELAKAYNLPVQDKPRTMFQKIGDIFDSKANVDQSVYGALLAEHPDQIRTLDASIAKKKRAENKIKRVAARWTSAIPIVGPKLSESAMERSKVDFNPMELARMKDPNSPNYDPLLKGISVGFGQSIGLRDVEDLAITLTRFAGIGGMTKRGIGLIATKFGKAKKMNAVLEGVDEALALGVAAKGIKGIRAHRIAKTAIDFNIDAYSNLWPELSQEGIAMEDKINAMVSTFPRATIEASLFGYFGGVKNVIGQYGGMFGAGYASALHNGADHNEAFKQGVLLTGMHFTNVLGVRGKKRLEEWGESNKISPELIKKANNRLVEIQYNKDKDIFTIESPEKYGLKRPTIKDKDGNDIPDPDGVGAFQILRKAGQKIRKRGSLTIRDLETGKDITLKGNTAANLLTDLSYRPTSDQYTNTGSALRQQNRSLITQLGYSGNSKGENIVQRIRRKVTGATRGEVGKVKEGEIPYWYDLQSPNKAQLAKDARRYNWDVEIPVGATKDQMISLIEATVPRQVGKRLSSKGMSNEQLLNEMNVWKKTLAERTVSRQLKDGTYSYKDTDMGLKVHHGAGNIIVSVQKNVQRKLKGDMRAEQRAKDIGKRAIKRLDELGIKESDQKTIFWAAAGHQKSLDKVSTSKELTEGLRYFQDQFAIAGEYGLKEGVIESLKENYWPGMYRGDAKENREKVDAYTKRNKGYFESLELTPGSPRAREKVFETPELAEAAGLEPIYNIPYALSKWWQSVGNAANSKSFIQNMKDMPGFPDGESLITRKNIKGYIPIESTALSEAMTGHPNNKIYAHPEIASEIAHLYNPWKPKDPTYAAAYAKYQKIRSNFKRLIMMNPVIHGWNIYSDAFDELWLSSWNNAFPVFKTARLTGFTPIPFLRAPEYGAKTLFDPTGARGKAKLEKMYKQWGFDGTTDGLRDLMARHGVNTEGHGLDLETHYGKLFPELQMNPDVTANKFSISKIRDYSDQLLWGRIVGGAQEAVFAMKYAHFMGTKKGTKLLKKGKGEYFTKEEAGDMAAHYVNDLFGTTGKEVFTPTEAATLNMMFFARNWTISNLRLISGARGTTDPNAKFLAHKGLTKEEMSAMQGEYAKHLVKGVIGMMGMTTALNYMATGTEGFTKEFDETKAQWSHENPEGHRLDMNLGLKDKRGRQIYVVPPMFRYIRDYFSWYGEPVKTFFNKLEPVTKNVLEQTMNYSQWSRQPIAKEEGFAGLKQRFKYSFEGLTPFGQYAPGAREFGYTLTGEEHLQSKTFAQLITPWFGTWVRHGAAGGREGELINEYLREIGIKRDEVDIYIDEMIMSGDIAGAIQEMIGKKRYRTLEGMRDRVRKFQNPFHYKYTTLLNRKRGERSPSHFRNWIRTHHPEDWEAYQTRLRKGISA